MPILPTAENRIRNREKTMLVLRFLRTTVYSTADILGEVMGLTDRAGIFRSLRTMEKMNLLQHRSFQEFGGVIRLWGITAHGHEVARLDGEEESQRVFNPSKISLANLSHYLDMQRVHVAGTKAGWTRFEYVDRTRRKKQFGSQKKQEENQYTVRPDLCALNPEGILAAIEIERTLKSESRYHEHIVPGHLRKLNAKEYQYVLWICRTPEQQQNLHELIKRVAESLRDAKKWHLDIPKVPYKVFQFANLQSWPNV